MKNLDYNLKKYVNEDLIKMLLRKAFARFPDGEVSYAGTADRWEDCLGGYVNKDRNPVVHLHFNLAKAGRHAGSFVVQTVFKNAFENDE